MKTLIIGEKPSIARKIVEGISLIEKIDKTNNYYESEHYVVSSCVGHLLKQAFPSEIDEKYKKWSFNILPFYFDNIPLVESSSTKDQLKLLKQLINRKDISEIVNACDADREGELIFRNLISYINPKGKTYSRMWIESVATPEVMKKQIEERQSQSIYDNLYESAKARSEADYFLGLNATMAMSVKYNKTFSIGRVITPTTKIVVDLERQIQNFVSKPFYKVSCDTNKIKGFSYKNEDLEDNRFLDKKDADTLIKKVGLGNSLVKKCEKKIEKEKAPKLFSLSDLQIECSKKYKYGAQDVLNACQVLYEAGFTTYPRTSENQISKEMGDECPNIVNALKDYFKEETKDILEFDYKINNSCIAKKEVASHEALTPTVKHVTDNSLNSFSTLEKNVYFEIVKRFLANFYPEAEYSVVNIEIERNKETFTKKDKHLKKLGFYKVLEKDVEDFEEINLNVGDTLDIIKFDLLEGKTEPPKRLTEGALIKIMQSPLKFVNDKKDKELLEETGGLGTEATRAGILENMKKMGYIELKKNTIYATNVGMSLIDAIPGDTIKSVPLTVEFERKLKEIKNGNYERKELIKEIMIMTREFVEDVKKSESSVETVNTSDNEICKCPNCGSSIVENKYGFGCSNWKNCKVNLYFNALERLGGKKLTKTQAKELFTTGKTKKKLDFVSKKSGKEYQAYVKYSFEKDEQYPNKTELEF